MLTCQAAVVREKSGPFRLETIGIEDPRDEEVLVRIAGVGMCHTDLVVRDQYFPTPLPPSWAMKGRAWWRRWAVA